MVKPKVYNYPRAGGTYGGTGTAPYASTVTKPAVATQPAKGEEQKDSGSIPSRPKPCIGNGWSGAANNQSGAAGNQNDYDDRYEDDYYNGHYPQHYYN